MTPPRCKRFSACCRNDPETPSKASDEGGGDCLAICYREAGKGRPTSGWAGSIRSRPEGDKRIVRESHGERQERRYLVGNNQEETWRVFLYWFQTFREPTFRQGEQVS
jgi:hypothetical protein